MPLAAVLMTFGALEGKKAVVQPPKRLGLTGWLKEYGFERRN
jgi:hypothetical protein